MTRLHAVTRTIAAALLLAALSACQSLGNGRAFQQSPEERARALRPGVTTREQVRRDLGDASVYRFADGREAWSYQSTSGLPKWVQFVPYVGLLPLDYAARTNELALLFDPQGVLRKVEWRTGGG
jgi:outer membrane protein assembly factor BamE (lipoprotein component of BamABCDE complex)